MGHPDVDLIRLRLRSSRTGTISVDCELLGCRYAYTIVAHACGVQQVDPIYAFCLTKSP